MMTGILEIRSLTVLLPNAAVGTVAIALLLRRRSSLPPFTVACLIAAIVLLVLSTGEIVAPLPRSGNVVVMVDLSPSTRSAAYRDRAALNDRLAQLLGSRAFKTIAFGERNDVLPAGDYLPDLPSRKTVFDPPADADAIILLSDGQFDPPATAPPTFPVIDGGLIDPPDTAVVDAAVRNGAADIAVSHRGEPRSLALDSKPGAPIGRNGAIAQRLPINGGRAVIHRAKVNAGDAWPENDALQFVDATPTGKPWWWVGNGVAPSGWLGIAPAALPTDPGQFLTPSVIALANVSADELSPAAQEHLQQYVRDLGGSLLIIGGDHAFSLGGYTGSLLDDLSPLASDPPTPTTRWLLVTDASGSMAASAAGPAEGGPIGGTSAAPDTAAGGATRWSTACGALTTVVRELPPADSVSVGSFAAELHWWVSGVSPRQAAEKPLPPANVSPAGPTNLQTMMEKLVAQLDVGQLTNLLILTDGEATLDHADAIAAAMKSKNVRLQVLAIGNGEALPALRSIVTATGGSFATELDSARWLAGVRTLVRGAMPDRTIAGEPKVVFVGNLTVLPTHSVPRANRVWLKSTATLMAHTDSVTTVDGTRTIGNAAPPLIARQAVGAGNVTACAFSPTDLELRVMASLMAGTTRDPRYRIDWQPVRRGTVAIDATDHGRPMNDLTIQLQLASLAGELGSVAFEQTAPGRYEATLPDSTEPRLAKVMIGGHELERQPIAGRYAHEFDVIGLDQATLTRLADRTGGRVIGPDQKLPIALPKSWRPTPLTPWLATAAAGLIAVGLVRWKRA